MGGLDQELVDVLEDLIDFLGTEQDLVPFVLENRNEDRNYVDVKKEQLILD